MIHLVHLNYNGVPEYFGNASAVAACGTDTEKQSSFPELVRPVYPQLRAAGAMSASLSGGAHHRESGLENHLRMDPCGEGLIEGFCSVMAVFSGAWGG